MNDKITIRWSVSDGYVGGDRPQTFKMDLSEFEGCSEKEIEKIIGDAVEEEFQAEISWACDTEKFAAEILAKLEGREEE
jgi:hypothetical protein